MPEDHMENIYNSKNIFRRFVHRSRLTKILKLVKGKSGTLLEAGCGEGHLLREISKINPNLRLYGVDVTKIAVEKAKKKVPDAVIKIGNLLNLDSLFKKYYFDVVICSEVLEHISQYELVIQNLEKMVKNNGTIIISFPNERIVTFARFLFGVKPIKAPDHVNSFTPQKIIKEFKSRFVYGENWPFNMPFWTMGGTILCFKKQD